MEMTKYERSVARRAAFTLVELLVVITIIGILAALLVSAAVGALGKAQETRIKAEIDQLDSALVEYKNTATAYPPNCQTDGSDAIVEAMVYNDLKKHLSLAFPRNQESDDLIRVLAGLPASNTANFPRPLAGGISAAEAIPFWTMAFSSDPKYPISGEGGPAYVIPSLGNANNRTLDPIESRAWAFEKTRLGPRGADKFFDQTNNRYIEYQAPNGTFRRINFWQYFPSKSEQPFLYFDTSRHEPTAPGFDPPAFATMHVHAFKKQGDLPNTLQFINPDKFQIIHAGRDGEWGDFDRMSIYEVGNTPDLFYPDGPFTGEIADTVVNFAEQTRIEDAQP